VLRGSHDLYRYFLAAAIWFVIAALVISAARAGKAASALYEKARNSATQSDVLSSQRAGEFAKAFAFEWATFNGDPDDYARRLRAFNPALRFHPPSGCPQKAVAAYLRSLERRADGAYEAEVSLDVQRPAGAADKDKTGVWADGRLDVRVCVREKDGGFYVPNTPVLVPRPGVPEIETRVDYGVNPSQTVTVALTNFLRAYYSGKSAADLTNLVVPESKILPVGGWELKSVDSVVVDTADAPARASVWATVTQEGFAVQQHLYLDLKSERGQVLVVRVSPTPN